jgi:hypothetical protein
MLMLIARQYHQITILLSLYVAPQCVFMKLMIEVFVMYDSLYFIYLGIGNCVNECSNGYINVKGKCLIQANCSLYQPNKETHLCDEETCVGIV